jgi:hypothetical protein
MCGCTPLSDKGLTPEAVLAVNMVSDHHPVAKPTSVTKYVIRAKTAKSGDSSRISTKYLGRCWGFLMAIGGHGHRA